MEQNNWINHPSLKNINKDKLKMILELTEQTNGKAGHELIPFFLALANKSKQEGSSFSKEELDTIIPVLKRGKSKDELTQMDKVLKMMTLLK
jgi:hypothetical protein